MLIHLKTVGVNTSLQISFIAVLGLGKQGLSHCQYTVDESFHVKSSDFLAKCNPTL